MSYVVGLAHAEQMFFVAALIAGHEFFHSLGKGGARRKCVDPDVVHGVFDRQRTGQRHDAAFGSSVCVAPYRAAQSYY